MSYGKFITPGKDDKEWFLGDTKTISYVVTFTDFTVLLYQEHADPEEASVISKSVVFRKAPISILPIPLCRVLCVKNIP